MPRGQVQWVSVGCEGSCAKGRSLWGLMVLMGMMKVLDSRSLTSSILKSNPSVLQKLNGEVKHNPQPNRFCVSGLKPQDEVQVQTSWLG